MWSDPIVAEVRKTRHAIEADCGDDFDKICERALRLQAQLAERVVSRKPLRLARPTGADANP